MVLAKQADSVCDTLPNKRELLLPRIGIWDGFAGSRHAVAPGRRCAGAGGIPNLGSLPVGSARRMRAAFDAVQIEPAKPRGFQTAAYLIVCFAIVEPPVVAYLSFVIRTAPA